MKIVDFSKSNSVVNKFIAEMRDVNVQNDRLRFRANIQRIGEVMAYEISRELNYETQDVTTPLGIAEVNVPDDQVVVGTILRAGLPLQQGVLNMFDDAETAFVSAYRKYDGDYNFDIHIEYIASPSLDDKVLVLCDPMLATGGSAVAAISAVKKRGYTNIRLMCLVGVPEGIKAMHEAHPDVASKIAAVAGASK